MNDSNRRQPSPVPAKATQNHAHSLDATTSLDDTTASPEDATCEPDAREGE
jgi:hypothetical protein